MDGRHLNPKVLTYLVLLALSVGCIPTPAVRWEVRTTSDMPRPASDLDLTPDGSLLLIDPTGERISVPLAEVSEVRWKSNAAIDWGGALGALFGGLAGCAIGRLDAKTHSPNGWDGLGRLLRGTVGGIFVGGALGGLTGAAIGSDDVCAVSTLSADTRVETVAKFIERHR